MFKLPKNIYVISLVMALSFAIISMMVFLAGILGAQIAPSPELATLPMAMMIAATGLATIPAALIMQRFGRKAGMAIGLVVSLSGCVIAFYAAQTANFVLLMVGASCMGLNAAFTHQARFIILENAQGEAQAADGLTLGLMANLVAAIIGPQLGAYGKELIDGDAAFSGSFVFAGGLIIAALLVLTLYKDVAIAEQQNAVAKRSLKQILMQPLFILAAGSPAIGYGVMSFIMTATPISMHEIDGHSLGHTKLVIQTHIIAMFLPSLISGALLKRGLRKSLIFTGMSLYVVVALIGFNGMAVLHYWWALAILGLGWNLLFMTSTALLPQAYTPEEKFKTQAANDFLIFAFQGVAAFAAGWVLFSFAWSGVIWTGLGVTLVWVLVATALSLKIKRLH